MAVAEWTPSEAGAACRPSIATVERGSEGTVVSLAGELDIATGQPFGHRRWPAVAEDLTSRSAPPIRQAIAWSTVAGLGVIHGLGAVGLIVVVRRPSVATLVLAGVLYAVSGLSITAGYHRLFAHRTYRASAPVRWFFLAFGAAAFQNSALAWSADHRAHHADTDGPDDPHAITNGVWWAHAGWLLRRRTASADVARLNDLWAIRSVRLQRRFYPIIAIALGLGLPTAIASTWGDPWGGVLVAGFLRSAVLLQATCCVNSLAHSLGRRTYDHQTSARDSTITALITFGEGYHSFHHRFPFDYRNGVSRWAYDPSKWMIWSLARLRLVNKTRTASQQHIARAVASAQKQRPPAPQCDPPTASRPTCATTTATPRSRSDARGQAGK
jgi:stearoyl-CoA desaturase (Delta-9 desaturase)